MANKNEIIRELEKESFQYLNWVIEVLHEHALWEDDGTYTFEDGETIRIFDPYEGVDSESKREVD